MDTCRSSPFKLVKLVRPEMGISGNKHWGLYCRVYVEIIGFLQGLWGLCMGSRVCVAALGII